MQPLSLVITEFAAAGSTNQNGEENFFHAAKFTLKSEDAILYMNFLTLHAFYSYDRETGRNQPSL